jgi:hypothetical protein
VLAAHRSTGVRARSSTTPIGEAPRRFHIFDFKVGMDAD